MLRSAFVLAASMMGSAFMFSQAAPSASSPAPTTSSLATSSITTSSTDGLAILQRVAQKYTDAKSYYLESVEETTRTSEYDRDWRKTVLIAAEAPGGRYHFEGRSMGGGAMKISDGKTMWAYQINEHRYTAKPKAIAASSAPTMMSISEMARMQAENLHQNLGQMVKRLKSAQRLPDATLTWDGREVSCYVVRILSADEKRTQATYSFEKTLWIDRKQDVILKTVEHNHFAPTGSLDATEQETTTIFPSVELDGPVRESVFTFIPPTDANLVQDFPDPRHDYAGSSLAGRQVPSLRFKSADGKAVSIESFRGKPLLIDNWATWCSPCVAALPQLAKIYQEGKDKGLVLLSVDRDEEAKTASEFLSKKGYLWPNYHDGDGRIEKIIGSSGIPRTMLIDANGKVVYDTTNSSEDELRTEIAKLGSDYAALSPKPKPAPCVASQ